MEFLDANNGWAVGGFCNPVLDEGEFIYHTADGGTTWTPQLGVPNYPLNEVVFVDPTNGWTVGGCTPEGYNWGDLWHTTDGGVTWTAQAIPDVIYKSVVIDFVDWSLGWAAANGAPSVWQPPSYVILHTTDMGNSWDIQAIDSFNCTINDVAFVDASHGWAVGSGVRVDSTWEVDSAWSLILHTVNGGVPADPPSDAEIPASYGLHNAYPNPFNSFTMIQYDLPRSGKITLRVFDLLGREVAVLKDEFVEAGTHQQTFDASGLASGLYFARLEAGKFFETKKLVLLK